MLATIQFSYIGGIIMSELSAFYGYQRIMSDDFPLFSILQLKIIVDKFNHFNTDFKLYCFKII